MDNQGTGSVYSSLITRQGLEGEDEALISIYREGETKGTFVDNGNGELAFTSDDGSVKGTIKINGWDGASFKVTETSGEAVFCRRGGQFSVCILTALFDMLFVMIQRYNRQRIMKLVNRQLRR